MFFHQFDIIFDSLKEIEERFKINPGEQEMEGLTNRLLKLRNIMDECVKYWLNFEERVNELQNKYEFSLPDLLPDDFLQNLCQDREKLNKKTKLRYKNGDKATLFFQIESEQGINYFRKGMGFWDLAMLEEAIREFEKLVKLEPNYIFGHFALVLLTAKSVFMKKH